MRPSRPFVLAYSPGVAADIREMLLPSMREAALALITGKIKAGVALGSPVASLTNPVLAGTRQVNFRTEEARRQGLGDGTIFYQLHPPPPSEGRPIQKPVVHIIAVAHPTTLEEVDGLRVKAAERLSPLGRKYALAFSPNVNRDMAALPEPERAAAKATIMHLVSQHPPPGRDPYSGEEVALPSHPFGAHAVRLMPFDTSQRTRAGEPARYAVCYQMLRPAVGSQVNAVQVIAVQEQRSVQLVEAAAARLQVTLRSTRIEAVQPTARQGRAAAARAHHANVNRTRSTAERGAVRRTSRSPLREERGRRR